MSPSQLTHPINNQLSSVYVSMHQVIKFKIIQDINDTSIFRCYLDALLWRFGYLSPSKRLYL